MITARPDPDFAALAARLAADAGKLIEAQLHGTALPKPARWRRASLLWPLFSKG